MHRTGAIISGSAVVLSAAWFYSTPGFEPAITFLAGAGGLVGSYFAKSSRNEKQANSEDTVETEAIQQCVPEPSVSTEDVAEDPPHTQIAEKTPDKTKYCKRCGAVPGKRSECTVGYSHDFVSSDGPVYCKRCGAKPGEQSECTVGYSHDFVAVTEPLYCKRCGTVPGTKSECTVGYSHDFVPLNSPVHCKRCGAEPGERSECTVGYSHDFVAT